MDYAATIAVATEEPHGRPREICGGGDRCVNRLHLCRQVRTYGAEAVRPLVAEPRYICRSCGRLASRASLLCKPSAL